MIYRDVKLKELRPFYRGWAGWNKWLQIAEGEIFYEQDADWFNYQKQGQVLDLGGIGFKRWIFAILRWIPDSRVQLILYRLCSGATWAKVRIKI